MKPLHFSLLTILTILLILSLAQHGLCRNQPPVPKTSTLKVLHISTLLKSPLSWEESVINELTEDRARLAYLSSLIFAGKSDSPVAWARNVIQSPNYVVSVKVGTPPQSFLMALDTSSDVAWLPCNGCLGCPTSPGSSLFASQQSSSFKSASCAILECAQITNSICDLNQCKFSQTYGGSTLSSTLSQDRMVLADATIPEYLFGCVQKATGASVPSQGLLGLGRGPLSLLSQTQNLYQSTFSYCLPSFKSSNFSGSLRLGPVAQPKKINYTPLLLNPKRQSLYYVNLLGIRVGSKTVDIPSQALAFDSSNGAGTIIDSGTVYTRLVEPAYVAVRDEFRRRMGSAQVSSLGGFDTCYSATVTIPSITFMFQGLNLTLSQDNLFLHSTSSSLACLAMAVAPNSNLNVIASMQQQNHRVFFDVPNSRLGISREPCT